MANEDQTTSWDGIERRGKTSWHVGKEIPLAFLGAMLLQTITFVAWFSDRAARLESKIDVVAEQMKEVRGERYTREDARRDYELTKQRDIEHERRLTILEANVDALQRRPIR